MESFGRRYVQGMVNKLFTIEELNGDKLCPTYMYRMVLAKFPNERRVYLHAFVGDDWTRDCHDHPKTFWSIGLWGKYTEEIFKDGLKVSEREYRAPWIRRFPAEHQHRIRCDKLAVTLVITGATHRKWGFWKEGVWIPYEEYLTEHGSSRASCD